VAARAVALGAFMPAFSLLGRAGDVRSARAGRRLRMTASTGESQLVTPLLTRFLARAAGSTPMALVPELLDLLVELLQLLLQLVQRTFFPLFVVLFPMLVLAVLLPLLLFHSFVAVLLSLLLLVVR